MRYEDTVKDPCTALHNIFKFVLGMNSLKGTVIENRIMESLKRGDEANLVYRPSNITMNKNKHRYTPEMLEYIKE